MVVVWWVKRCCCQASHTNASDRGCSCCSRRHTTGIIVLRAMECPGIPLIVLVGRRCVGSLMAIVVVALVAVIVAIISLVVVILILCVVVSLVSVE